MATTHVTRQIAAPPARVFDVVAHIENFADVIPEIVNVEFITDSHRGVGTRFRETRLMKKRQATTTLEVTEYVDNERIRLVADEGGTVWDTVFTVAPVADGTRLDMTMEARPHKLLARLMNPLIAPMIRKAVEKDMDRTKQYCEAAT